jgi:uncharacterized protein (DUF433 family)
MTITIELPPEVEAQAQAQANAQGIDLETWLRHLAEVALKWPATETHRTRGVTFEGDGFPGIESNPDIMDGEARILRTRIPVWLLVGLRNQGMSDGELLVSYPALSQADLAQAWGYAALHPDEIERALRDQQEAE